MDWIEISVEIAMNLCGPESNLYVSMIENPKPELRAGGFRINFRGARYLGLYESQGNIFWESSDGVSPVSRFAFMQTEARSMYNQVVDHLLLN